MKIVIDISEEEYEDAKKAGGCYYDFGKAIYYGIPLDKIRAEIWDLQYGNEEKSETDEDMTNAYNNAISQVIEIIDKYKAESEE